MAWESKESIQFGVFIVARSWSQAGGSWACAVRLLPQGPRRENLGSLSLHRYREKKKGLKLKVESNKTSQTWTQIIYCKKIRTIWGKLPMYDARSTSEYRHIQAYLFLLSVVSLHFTDNCAFHPRWGKTFCNKKNYNSLKAQMRISRF